MLFLGSPNKITGDVTFAVDWVLKTDYLSTLLLYFLCTHFVFMVL